MNIKEIDRKSSCESITPIYACKGNLLSFETEDLYHFVKKWLDNTKLTFSNFAGFMKTLQLELPVKFRDFDYFDGNFICETNTGKTVRIHLFSVNILFPQIVVTNFLDNGLTDELAFEVKKQANSSHVKLCLLSRTLQSRDRSCEVRHKTNFRYSSTTYFRYSEYMITVCILPEVNITSNSSRKRIKAALARLNKNRNFPELLLNIDTADSNFVDKIFQEILRILDLPFSDFEKLYMVYVGYVYKSNDERQELSQILCNNGKIDRYAKIIDCQLYDVSDLGNWRYLCPNLSLEHSSTGETIVTCSTDLISEELKQNILDIEKETLKLRAYLGKNSSLLKK